MNKMGRVDRIEKVRWFTQMNGCLIGIVMLRDGITMERKSYIGVASGSDEKFDAEYIAATGASFPLDIAELMEMTPVTVK